MIYLKKCLWIMIRVWSCRVIIHPFDAYVKLALQTTSICICVLANSPFCNSIIDELAKMVIFENKWKHGHTRFGLNSSSRWQHRSLAVSVSGRCCRVDGSRWIRRARASALSSRSGTEATKRAAGCVTGRTATPTPPSQTGCNRAAAGAPAAGWVPKILHLSV